jgi:hypothetical protein
VWNRRARRDHRGFRRSDFTGNRMTVFNFAAAVRRGSLM